eukprot:350675-Chlamydomonas_euryale.AAC.2
MTTSAANASTVARLLQAARQGAVYDYLVAQRLEQQADGTLRGLQRVAAFLQPQDAAYFDAGGQAVAVFDYSLFFVSLSWTSCNSDSLGLVLLALTWGNLQAMLDALRQVVTTWPPERGRGSETAAQRLGDRHAMLGVLRQVATCHLRVNYASHVDASCRGINDTLPGHHPPHPRYFCSQCPLSSQVGCRARVSTPAPTAPTCRPVLQPHKLFRLCSEWMFKT